MLECLLAQTSQSSSTERWTFLITNLSSVGIAVWYLWYRTTKADPRDRREQRLHIQEITTGFRKSLAAHRRSRKEELKEDREEKSQLLSELRAERAARQSFELSQRQRDEAMMACITKLTDEIRAVTRLISQMQVRLIGEEHADIEARSARPGA